MQPAYTAFVWGDDNTASIHLRMSLCPTLGMQTTLCKQGNAGVSDTMADSISNCFCSLRDGTHISHRRQHLICDTMGGNISDCFCSSQMAISPTVSARHRWQHLWLFCLSQIAYTSYNVHRWLWLAPPESSEKNQNINMEYTKDVPFIYFTWQMTRQSVRTHTR